MNDTALRALAADPSSRKRFLKMVGGTGAVGAVSLLLAACGHDDDAASRAAVAAAEGPDASGGGDLEIVNYALNLEYVEAALYREALATGLITDTRTADLFKKFGETERAHVAALRSTAEKLGGPAAEAPRTKFKGVLAGGPQVILETAATIENVGAGAYLGQAGNIKDSEILAAVLAIHSVEARHAAALNELAGRGLRGSGPFQGTLPDGAFAKPLTMNQALARIKPYVVG